MMWRTFVVPVLHKQAGLLKNSNGCCISRVCNVHVTGNEYSNGSAKLSVTKQREITSQNLAKAQNAVVGLLFKLHDGCSGKNTYKVEQFPFIQSLLDHISRHASLGEECQNSKLTTCTPKARRNEKESGFGFKNICISFEKWCYGVVVVSSLISWHRLLFKDERKTSSKDQNIWNIYDFVNIDGPLRVLPVNGPAKPIDPLDKACSSLESAMEDCVAVTENALAIRFSTLKLHEKALTFFQSASQRGNVAAHFNVGLCYEKGLGTTRDISKAVRSYKLAASYGHLNAAFNLAMILLQGDDTSEKTDGLEMMGKAAKGSLTKAQRFLGLYYADDGNEHYDMKKSVHWLQLASEQNDAEALYHLGICYEKGLGVARNMQKAREMYDRAAENGHSGAQFNYAVFHEHGLGGLCINKHEALRWYSTAAENGNANAKNNLEYLQKELAPGKGNPNLLRRLFADIFVSKQPAGSSGMMPRCSSSPGRLFMQSDLNSTVSLQGSASGEQDCIAYEDNKCVWVI